MSRLTLSCLIAMVILAAPAAQVGDQDLRELFHQHAWLALREAVGPASPKIFHAAVAAAFNQSKQAEGLLQSVIEKEARSEDANQAYALLSAMYLRAGRYGTLLANLDRWSVAFAGRPEVAEAQADVEQFRGLPDQVNDRARRATVAQHGGDIFVPLTIDGEAVTFFFDTGAWVSVLAETEASRLGLRVRDAAGTIGDSSGRGVKTRMAVADHVTLGPLHARNVSFLVVPDQEPFTSLPSGRRGIIGMPLLVALERIEWARAGTVTLGGDAPASGRPPNLMFDGNHLLTLARVFDRDVRLTLDTGATTTDLNRNFAEAFASVVVREGTKNRQAITGLGGTQVDEAISVPEVAFELGGRHVNLRPASVTLQQRAGIGGRCCVGNLGLDLLRQGEAFTIDLSRMELALR